MATINLTATTTATPEQFVEALTDFGPGRSELFGNSADEYLEVHYQDAGHADVTEGSGGVWERLSYDWTDPDRVVLTTTDSNVWGGASGHTYTFARQIDGTTAVDAVVIREGKNLKGRLLAVVLGTVGKRVLAKAFAQTVEAIEARNESPMPPGRRRWRPPPDTSGRPVPPARRAGRRLRVRSVASPIEANGTLLGPDECENPP